MQDVDIFSKDYIFIPIHDALHWSLIIICHPGQPAPDKTTKTTGKSSSSQDAAQLSPSPAPVILHLDSMSGGHTTKPIADHIRAYLLCEWDAKLQEPEPSDPGAALNTSQKWRQENGPGEFRDFGNPSVFPHLRVGSVPQQDNHCDCGLFLCTYVEYFTFSPPPALNKAALEAIQPKRKTGRAGSSDGAVKDLWAGQDSVWYPYFMRRQWFPSSNAGRLRLDMRRKILVLMGVRV